MLQPKRTKYRKDQKGRMKGVSQRGHQLSNGTFGIKSLESAFITARQIESARVKDSFGSKFSQISLLPKNLWKYVWVRVKELLSTG